MGGAPAVSTVRQALDVYLSTNGFDVAAYDAPTYEVDMAEVTGDVWTFRNTPARKRAVPFHDLHHVATGYGTDVLGEAEIGAWELVAGCDSLFLWWINASAVGLGLLIGPRRTVRALWRAIGQRSLYRERIDYDEALAMAVVELRARLGIRPEGQADRPPRHHRRAPVAAIPAAFAPCPSTRALVRVASAALNPLLGGSRTTRPAS